jgi:hypothetical protein
MAQQRLRPGSWKLVDSGAGSVTQTIQIDYEKFDLADGGTVEFEVAQMGLYDDTTITAFRNPVATVQSTTSTGVAAKPMSTPYFKQKR